MPVISPTVAIILLMLALLILSFRMSAYLLKRAVCRVISIFRQYNAVRVENARKLEELGLGPRPFLELRLWRDYKPYALKMLTQNSIVRGTPEGKFYLIEEDPELVYGISCPSGVSGSQMRSLLSGRSNIVSNHDSAYTGRKK